MKKDTRKDFIIKFIDAINNHQVDEIVSLMSDDHIFIDGQGNTSMGKQGMSEGWKGYFELFPDYTIEVTDIIAGEPVIGLFGFVHATYKNIADESNSNFWKTPASWKAIVENNKIKHWQVYCDYSNLFKIIDKNK